MENYDQKKKETYIYILYIYICVYLEHGELWRGIAETWRKKGAQVPDETNGWNLEKNAVKQKGISSSLAKTKRLGRRSFSFPLCWHMYLDLYLINSRQM